MNDQAIEALTLTEARARFLRPDALTAALAHQSGEGPTELDLVSAIQRGADSAAEFPDEYCSGAMALGAAREVLALLALPPPQAPQADERREAEVIGALRSANDLIDMIEGPFGWATATNAQGFRLKDDETYVTAYLAIREALRAVPTTTPSPDWNGTQHPNGTWAADDPSQAPQAEGHAEVRAALQDLCDAWDHSPSTGHKGGKFKGNITTAQAVAKRVLEKTAPPLVAEPKG